MELSKINKLTIGNENYNFSQEAQVGNMTGLGGIDVTKDVIYSTIDSQTNISISGECEVGKKITVICESSVNTSIKIDDSKVSTSTEGNNTLVTSPGDVFTLEIYCTGVNKYFLIKKGINELPFSGEVGDIVLYSFNTDSFISVTPGDLSKFSDSNYTPIGIVAIPSSSGRYGDGISGIISLEDLESGAEVYWGEEKLTGITKDLDGSDNTKQCLLFRGKKDYGSWYPDYTNENDYPAATLCNRYTVFGKSISSNRLLANTGLSERYGSAENGNWYLPVISELSSTNLDIINTSIDKVSEVFTSINTSNVIGNYWSSTESSIEDVYCYSTAFGKTNSKKLEKRKVRAFIKINSNGEIVPTDIDYDSPIEFSIHINRGESNPSRMVTVEGSNPELFLSKFRRCMFKLNGKTARICFLDDKDSTKFEDGTTANLEGLDGDVMVYFPEFWYLGEEIGPKHVWNICSSEKPGYHHSPASLVGTYKGVVRNGLLKSISNSSPSSIFNDNSLIISSDNLMSYHQHCIIAWMFLARYGTVDSQSKCGAGVGVMGNITTGSTNSLGIRDTSTGLVESSINFLGLEDIWGNLGELIKNVNVIDSDIIVTRDDRVESIGKVNNLYKGDGIIKDIVSGSYMDIIPYLSTVNSSETRYYTDSISIDDYNNTLITIRSTSLNENSDINNNGVFTINLVNRDDILVESVNRNVGARLGFNGIIDIAKNSYEFRNPPHVPVEFSIHISKSESDPSRMIAISGGDPELLLRRFRRCIASKKQDEDGIKIRYLNDFNSNYYSDLSLSNTDGTDGDVMVYFPEMWYLGTDTGSEWVMNISTVEKEGWKHAPASLVGAYKAIASDTGDSTSGGLYSKSGADSSGNISMANFSTKARNRGAGYHLIDYQQHCIIAWMFYARYKNTNSQAICGTGKNASSGVNCGVTNSLGMNDTTAETASGSSNILVNFLGLEGCWGYKFEYMEGIHSYETDGTIAYDKGDYHDQPFSSIQSSTKRILRTPSEGSLSGMAKKIIGGEYIDMIVTDRDGDSATYFCDNMGIYPSNNRISYRSYYVADVGGGVSSINGYYSLSSDYKNNSWGSRLAFDGNIEINNESIIRATVIIKSTPSNAKIQYKVDNGLWTSISSGQSIEVVLGSTVYYKASLTGYYDFTEESRVINTVASTISITLRQVTEYQFEIYPAFDDQTYEVQYSINNKNYDKYTTGGLITSLKRNDTIYYRAFGKGYTCEYGNYTATVNSNDHETVTISHESSKVVFNVNTDELGIGSNPIYSFDTPSIEVYNSTDPSDYTEFELSEGKNTISNIDYGWSYGIVKLNYQSTYQTFTRTGATDYTKTITITKTNRWSRTTSSSDGIIDINLSKYNSSAVVYMDGLFQDCAVTRLNLSTFVFRRVRSMVDMFKGCSRLTYIDLSNYTQADFTSNSIGSNGENATGMFLGCDSLNHIKCRQWFKDWCIKNQDTINLPNSLRDGNGTWEVYS